MFEWNLRKSDGHISMYLRQRIPTNESKIALHRQVKFIGAIIISELILNLFNRLNTLRKNIILDIDECELINGGCEDLCINTPGSYYCNCK